MKKLSLIFVAILLNLTIIAQTEPGFIPMKELFRSDFLVGTAVNGRSITGDAGMTWLNGFPVRGRTDYPLLFDRDMKPKKAYYSVKSVYQK